MTVPHLDGRAARALAAEHRLDPVLIAALLQLNGMAVHYQPIRRRDCKLDLQPAFVGGKLQDYLNLMMGWKS